MLVATDIAARGLDIDQLPHVINFELPQMAEDYIHRIGRTGRAGRGGEAISLVSQDELGQLKEIEALIGQSLTVEILEGYEPSGKPSRQTLPGSKPVQNPPRARGHANAKGKPAAGKGKGMAPRSRPSLRKTSPASGKWWARTSVSPHAPPAQGPGATIRTTPTRSEAARALRPEQQNRPRAVFLCLAPLTGGQGHVQQGIGLALAIQGSARHLEAQVLVEADSLGILFVDVHASRPRQRMAWSTSWRPTPPPPPRGAMNSISILPSATPIKPTITPSCLAQ